MLFKLNVRLYWTKLANPAKFAIWQTITSHFPLLHLQPILKCHLSYSVYRKSLRWSWKRSQNRPSGYIQIFRIGKKSRNHRQMWPTDLWNGVDLEYNVRCIKDWSYIISGAPLEGVSITWKNYYHHHHHLYPHVRRRPGYLQLAHIRWRAGF